MKNLSTSYILMRRLLTGGYKPRLSHQRASKVAKPSPKLGVVFVTKHWLSLQASLVVYLSMPVVSLEVMRHIYEKLNPYTNGFKLGNATKDGVMAMALGALEL